MGVVSAKDQILSKKRCTNNKIYTAEEREVYCQKHGRIYDGWERALPTGWHFSGIIKGKRILKYFEKVIASLEDDFDIKEVTWEVINNTPMETLAFERYKFGLGTLEEITNINDQRACVLNGYVDEITAYDLYPRLRTWLTNARTNIVKFEGHTYKRNGKCAQWFDENNRSIARKRNFKSIQEARVVYGNGECSLSDVARYRWSAVLLCLGDDFQKYYESLIDAAERTNKDNMQCIRDALDQQDKRQRKAVNHQLDLLHEHDLTHFYNLPTKENHTTYHQQFHNHVAQTISEQLKTDLEYTVDVFRQDIRFKDSWMTGVLAEHAQYVEQVKHELKSLVPELVSFKWNSSSKQYSPIYAPQILDEDRATEFWTLVDRVIYGEISGQEAKLAFKHTFSYIIETEHSRYKKTRRQFNPYALKKRRLINTGRVSITEAVSIMIDHVKSLMGTVGRDSAKTLTAFNYKKIRFLLDINTGKLSFMSTAVNYHTLFNRVDSYINNYFKDNEQERIYFYKQKRACMYARKYPSDKNLISSIADDYIRRYMHPSRTYLDSLKQKAKELITEYNNYRKEHNIFDLTTLGGTLC